jgi:hypothetical protein
MEDIRCDSLAQAANMSFVTSVEEGQVTFKWFAVCNCGDTVATDLDTQEEAEVALEDHRSKFVWRREAVE